MTDEQAEHPHAPVRDGLPTADEIQQACALLQVPLYPQGMGLGRMTGERQVTALLAVLSSWITCYQVVNDGHLDRLTLDEMRSLLASADAETCPDTQPDQAVAVMNGVLWRIQWAALSLEALCGAPEAANPVPAIAGLLRAAGLLVTEWRSSHDTPGFSIGDRFYSASSGDYAKLAMQEILGAVDHLTRLMGGVAEPG
jgi:hypothetical protein